MTTLKWCLNCCRPGCLLLNCTTKFELKSKSFLSWPQSPVLTSLHHLQDEGLMLRTHRESLPAVTKQLRSYLFTGISPFCLCQILTAVTEGAAWRFGYFTKIRLALFSPYMFRDLLYFSDEWLAPCAVANPSQFEGAIGHDCNWCSLHGYLQCIVNQLL